MRSVVLAMLLLPFPLACSRSPLPAAPIVADAAGPPQPDATAVRASAAAPASEDARVASPEDAARCDASRKPRGVVVDASTRVKCKAAGGKWLGTSDVVPAPPGPAPVVDAPRANAVCEVVGRGRLECKGCVELPTGDGGKACRYDWDCEAICEGTRCAARFSTGSEYGCRDRCIDGHIKTLCVD